MFPTCVAQSYLHGRSLLAEALTGADPTMDEVAFYLESRSISSSQARHLGGLAQ